MVFGLTNKLLVITAQTSDLQIFENIVWWKFAHGSGFIMTDRRTVPDAILMKWCLFVDLLSVSQEHYDNCKKHKCHRQWRYLQFTYLKWWIFMWLFDEIFQRFLKSSNQKHSRDSTLRILNQVLYTAKRRFCWLSGWSYKRRS